MAPSGCHLPGARGARGLPAAAHGDPHLLKELLGEALAQDLLVLLSSLLFVLLFWWNFQTQGAPERRQ